MRKREAAPRQGRPGCWARRSSRPDLHRATSPGHCVCVRRVERALLAIPGVSDAKVNLVTRTTTVTFDPSAASTAGHRSARAEGRGAQIRVRHGDVQGHHRRRAEEVTIGRKRPLAHGERALQRARAACSHQRTGCERRLPGRSDR
ncbi:heavy metal translocating P-type ATPase [Sorangium cellulosum]|uniref:heavy-metal-associated domain-containing protein n=1 Tax=Sorangium cellulosum TaxID=56 RepID=UPI0012FF857F